MCCDLDQVLTRVRPRCGVPHYCSAVEQPAALRLANRHYAHPSGITRPPIDECPRDLKRSRATQPNCCECSATRCRSKGRNGVLTLREEDTSRRKPRLDRRHNTISEREAHPRLEHSDIFTSGIRSEERPKSCDGIERTSCQMVERAPVIRNEKSRLQSLEEDQCIVTCQMAAPEAWFPPRCVTNWKKSNIELPPSRVKGTFYEFMRPAGKTGIPCKEAAHAGGFYQVHVGGASPLVDPVSAAPMLGHGSVDGYASQLYGFPRAQCPHL